VLVVVRCFQVRDLSDAVIEWTVAGNRRQMMTVRTVATAQVVWEGRRWAAVVNAVSIAVSLGLPSWLSIGLAVGLIVGCGMQEGRLVVDSVATQEAAPDSTGDSRPWQLHDAGHVREGGSVRHVFSFRNPTESLLRVAVSEGVRKSCGCTSASLADSELHPGQATALSVEVDTKGKRGLLQEVVHVDWIDERGATMEAGFGLRAVVDAAVVWTPGEVVVSREQVGNEEMLVAIAESDLPVDWANAIVRSDSDYLQIREQAVTAGGHLRIGFRCVAGGTGEARTGRLTLEAPLHGSATGETAGDGMAGNAAGRTELRGTVAAAEGLRVTGELLVLSQDSARLRASPRRLVLRRSKKEPTEWHGRVVLTGDRVGEGVRVVGIASTWGVGRAATSPLSGVALQCDVVIPTSNATDSSNAEDSLHGGGEDAAGESDLLREGRLVVQLDDGAELELPATLQAAAAEAD
jgi:hypothetical protein